MHKPYRIVILLALAAAVFGWWVWSEVFVPGSKRLEESKSEVSSLEAELALVQAENARLKDKVDRLKNDPLYQEKVIREKLKYVRQDELVYHAPEE